MCSPMRRNRVVRASPQLCVITHDCHAFEVCNNILISDMNTVSKDRQTSLLEIKVYGANQGDCAGFAPGGSSHRLSVPRAGAARTTCASFYLA